MPLSQSRRRVLTIALMSRFLILVGMMTSCRLIPDHNPGDDVQQFEMRLSSGCFCREGQACPYHTDDSPLQDCSVDENRTVARSIVTGFYKVMLPPLTRWDAARFLSLAADPSRRHPYLPCDESDESDIKEICSVPSFVESEQAHAFLPLVPMLIRAVAYLLVWLPASLLPPTHEGMLVLAAWLLNTTAFILAALSLHELTYCITRRHAQRDESEKECVQCACTTALLFCFNPASVFFSSAYSESMFAMLTFTGYALATQRQWFLAVACWTASSYARSNGTMTCLWIALETIGQCSLQSRSMSMRQKICSILFAAASIGCIVLPVLYHDWSGYNLLCNTVHASPDWCQRAADSRFFSLYRYVQRKHWNVGFLRYYQWKQIPNFLLAFPILFLGLSAVVVWVHRSWTTFINLNKELPHKTLWSRSLRLVHWALFAFRASQEAPILVESNEDNGYAALLVAPGMLSYYAGLAAACLVGGTIAHVQISTRLICSSCPAIYWYMAAIYLSDSEPGLTRALLNRKAIVYYCLGYIVLGIVMHVNWLPWT